MTYNYSPRPILDYRLPGFEQDEVTVILGHRNHAALWNFFWLTQPGIDSVPGAGKDWWKAYKPIVGCLRAAIEDLMGDKTLESKLLEHPYAFAKWFEGEQHDLYNTYEVMGGQTWVSNVLNRAELAGERLTKAHPPVRIEGNVIHICFA